MNPQKAKEFVKPTAEELEVSENLVKDLINFYWKEVRNTISNLIHYNVLLVGLGSFRIKTWKIDSEIEKHKKIIASYKKAIDGGEFITMQRFASMKEYESRLQNLERVKKIIDKDELKKAEVKKKKDEYYRENMEEQNADS